MSIVSWIKQVLGIKKKRARRIIVNDLAKSKNYRKLSARQAQRYCNELKNKGLTSTQIAKELNNMNLLTPRGKIWKTIHVDYWKQSEVTLREHRQKSLMRWRKSDMFQQSIN